MAIIKELKNKKGISIIEILVVVAIISIALTSLLGITSFSLKILSSIKKITYANSLAQEMIEATRAFRDETDWDIDGLGTLTEGLDYYPQEAGSPLEWQLVQDVEVINGFTRRIVFEGVTRDLNDNIVEAGGVSDLYTKKITATVSWDDEEIEIFTYLAHWRE